MNTHQRWARKMTTKPMPLIAEIEQQAADRERMRIRRVQAAVLGELRAGCAVPDQGMANAYVMGKLHELDAATRAPRAKRRRGK